ncbi:MAG: PaaI family thioesterase [Candidatus Rokuibacteriota bacterium]
MATTDAILRQGLEGQGPERILTLDPAFQGLPDTAHGGSVLAAFCLLAEPGPPLEMQGLYRKRVPLGMPLRLRVDHADDERVECRLLEAGDTTLVAGCIRRCGADMPSPARVGRTMAADPLPVSSTCFACGVDNRLGLGVRLSQDDDAVWGRWPARENFCTPDGALAPVALTALLDETAFWLGALASGESGMTTELVVRLRGRVPFGPAITVGGRRDAVRPRPDDPRYWDTAVTAWDADGRVVAEAAITFVAVRGSARRLAAWLLRVNSPQVVRRVFPAYA